MGEIKGEYKIELDAVFQAKLAVLVETQKMKAPHAPVTGSDILNKATALGINSMLRMTLNQELTPMPYVVNTPLERAGDVGTLVE